MKQPKQEMFMHAGGNCCPKCLKMITAVTTNSENKKKTKFKFPQCSNPACECHILKASTSKPTETWRESLRELYLHDTSTKSISFYFGKLDFTPNGVDGEYYLCTKESLESFIQSTLDEATSEARESGYSHGWLDSIDAHFEKNKNELDKAVQEARKEALEDYMATYGVSLEAHDERVRKEQRELIDGKIEGLKRTILHPTLRVKGKICDACSEDFTHNQTLDQVHDIIKQAKGK